MLEVRGRWEDGAESSSFISLQRDVLLWSVLIWMPRLKPSNMVGICPYVFLLHLLRIYGISVTFPWGKLDYEFPTYSSCSPWPCFHCFELAHKNRNDFGVHEQLLCKKPVEIHMCLHWNVELRGEISQLKYTSWNASSVNVQLPCFNRAPISLFY